MSNSTDDVARWIAVAGLVAAAGSSLISLLSYRRDRGRLSVTWSYTHATRILEVTVVNTGRQPVVIVTARVTHSSNLLPHSWISQLGPPWLTKQIRNLLHLPSACDDLTAYLPAGGVCSSPTNLPTTLTSGAATVFNFDGGTVCMYLPDVVLEIQAVPGVIVQGRINPEWIREWGVQPGGPAAVEMVHSAVLPRAGPQART